MTLSAERKFGSGLLPSEKVGNFFQTRLLFEEIYHPCFLAKVFGVLSGESFSAKVSKSSESRLLRKFIILLCGAEKQNPQS